MTYPSRSSLSLTDTALGSCGPTSGPSSSGSLSGVARLRSSSLSVRRRSLPLRLRSFSLLLSLRRLLSASLSLSVSLVYRRLLLDLDFFGRRALSSRLQSARSTLSYSRVRVGSFWRRRPDVDIRLFSQLSPPCCQLTRSTKPTVPNSPAQLIHPGLERLKHNWA